MQRPPREPYHNVQRDNIQWSEPQQPEQRYQKTARIDAPHHGTPPAEAKGEAKEANGDDKKEKDKKGGDRRRTKETKGELKRPPPILTKAPDKSTATRRTPTSPSLSDEEDASDQSENRGTSSESEYEATEPSPGYEQFTECLWEKNTDITQAGLMVYGCHHPSQAGNLHPNNGPRKRTCPPMQAARPWRNYPATDS